VKKSRAALSGRNVFFLSVVLDCTFFFCVLGYKSACAPYAGFLLNESVAAPGVFSFF
jgi:hypothetical protein